MSRITFECRTSKGALIGPAFDDRKRALKHARDNADTFPGLTVWEVVTPEPVARRIWRANLQLVGAS